MEQINELINKRLRELKLFTLHLVIYLLINFIFVLTYITRITFDPWFLWVSFTWGIFLAAHALSVFAFGPTWSYKKEKELTELFKNLLKTDTADSEDS